MAKAQAAFLRPRPPLAFGAGLALLAVGLPFAAGAASKVTHKALAGLEALLKGKPDA